MIYGKILIIQTAFLGDVILTLPLLQILEKQFLSAEIDFLCIPSTADLLKNNPYINEVIVYDKKKSGLKGLSDLIKNLRNKKYDLLFSPHRSFRSSIISYLSSAGKTISFKKSSLSFLYDYRADYGNSIHEIQRNLRLASSVGIPGGMIIKPELFPGEPERRRVDEFLIQNKINEGDKIISIAPGSVWFTKRFPADKFVLLCDLLESVDCKLVLTGGKADSKISEYILTNTRNPNVFNSSGSFSILESSELIRRSKLLITNDSAPLHIANSFGTNVIAIFGATVPSFGFYPYGKNDIVFETNGLSCRPCSIHGGNKCPVKTFECMMKISEESIFESVKKLLS